MNDHQVYAAIAILVVLAMALWLSLRGLRRAEALEKRADVLETELAATRESLAQGDAAARDAAAEAARRHAEIESRIATLMEQQEQLRLLDEGSGGYSHAIRLAQRGASVEELARDCGLNRGEAELLVSLHGRSSEI